MNRRNFLQSSLLTVGAVGLTSSLKSAEQDAKQSGPREYYELRRYQIRRGPMEKQLNDYLQGAAIPAWRRAGCGPIGVFGAMIGPESPSLTVLIPHASIEAFASCAGKLKADAEYQKRGKEFIESPQTMPGFVRIDSSLHLAFTGMPKLEVPPGAAQNKSRIFEMRTYESPSPRTAELKIQMFNDGEIDIFRRTGLMPVFFGETIIGSRMPNLVYMVWFDDLAAREKNWGLFGRDPEWKRISKDPIYGETDTLSNITNEILRPTSYSQL